MRPQAPLYAPSMEALVHRSCPTGEAAGAGATGAAGAGAGAGASSTIGAGAGARLL